MRKNILLFGHGYGAPFIDVSNQYTQLFAAQDHAVTVAYLVGAPSEEIKQQHLAENVIFLNSPKKSTRGLKLFAIKKMLQLHKEKNFALVICHRYKPTYIMLWVALFKKIPVLFSIMHELGTFKSFARKLAISLLAKTNITFAGVSNAVRDDLKKSLWKISDERIITLYNMIDVQTTESQLLTRAAARQYLNIAPEDFIFGNSGRLVVNKDQKTLISAFAKIKPHCPNAKLFIMGTGPLELELKNQVKQLNLTNDVIFAGFIPQGFCYLTAFDVLVSSSTQEAFGRILLEAMIAKVPIIATKVNGVPEVIADTGILIAATDTEQLAQAMSTLFTATTEERTQLGEKGYQRASNEFSLEQFKKIFWGIEKLL